MNYSKHSKILTFSLKHLIIAVLMSCFVMLIGYNAPAHAQIVKSSRLELNDNDTRFSLAPFSYLTSDKKKKYTGASLYQSHLNNKRGTQPTHNIINFGPSPVPTWLLFSLTNNSVHEEWILDFGTIMTGRLSQAKAIKIQNHQTGEILLDWADNQKVYNTPGALALNMTKTAIPLNIPSGSTAFYSVYIELNSSFLNTINPTLIKAEDYVRTSQMGQLIIGLYKICLIGLFGFFIALCIMQKSLRYFYFALYTFAFFLLFAFLRDVFLLSHSLILTLPQILFVLPSIVALLTVRTFFNLRENNYSVGGSIIIHIGTVSVITVLSALLPGENLTIDDHLIYLCALSAFGASAAISFNQAKEGKYGGVPLLAGFLLILTAYGFLYMESFSVITTGIWSPYFLWLAVLIQTVLCMLAAIKRIELVTQDELSNVAREYRTAQSLARLKQSKENADQARLLRVIERERELMAELREREIQRTEEMRRAKEAADEANRAKSAFLAVVSHEIRTPMNGIMGIVRLMLDTKMTKQQNDYLQTIHKSGDSMMSLLNDILDFEKIETGNMELEQINFDLIKLVDGVERLMTGHAQEKNLTLTTQISENFPPTLKGDPTRLRQILLNLVNNAIKFTSSGGITIHLKAQKKEQTKPDQFLYEIYCAVEDTGIGISKDAQAKLFNPFTQAEKETSRKYGGTGLGLAICMRLLEAMGSTIQVNSEPEQGSTFYFTVYLEGSETEEAEDDSSQSDTIDTSASTYDIVTSPIHVLVIDDNETNRQVLSGYLEHRGHSVTEAETAEDAINLFEDGPDEFDLILTDIQLTGMNGIEFTRRLRQNDFKIPIAAVTGNVSEDDRELYISEGFNGVIEKPVNPEKLYALIKTLINSDQEPNAAEEALEKSATEDTVRLLSQDIENLASEHEAFMDDESFDSFAEAAALDDDAQPAQEEPSPATNILDPAYMKGLAEALPKEQFAELLQSCLDKNAELTEVLSAQLDEADLKTMQERGHELKGMSANFGFTEMSKLGSVIEKAAKDQDENAAFEAIRQLPEAQARAEEAAQNWLNRLS